jgi:hypothetical protein
MVEGQLWTLLGIAVIETQAGHANVGARLLGRTKELALRLGDPEELAAWTTQWQTMSKLEAALGREQLASELAVGSSLSMDEAIALALGRSAE